MDYNEHNNEAEALFATKRKQQQAEEAERKRLEELEQQKRQMAEEVKRLEALQAAQREQQTRMAQQAQWAQQPQQAQQNYGVPGTGAAPTGGKSGLDPKKKKIILISAIGAFAVILLAVILILALGSKSKPEDEPGSSQRDERSEVSTEGVGEYDPELLYFNGHSYEFVDLDLSWNDARAYCIEQGGHLVTITTPEEQDFLANNFYDQKLWIGAFESETGWCWITGEAWYYENWRSGEPSGGEEWCGCLWTDMEWNDIRNEDPGERISAFICEYDDLEDVYSLDWDVDDSDLQYFNGHYYQFFDMDTSWSEARDFCIQQGGHLVTVTSPEEQAFLTDCYLNINGSDAGPWLGAYSNGAFGGSKNDWCWVTGEEWDYSNWEPGEPSNSRGTEWYAHFWKKMQWNDVADDDPRNSQHGFICEYDDWEDEAVANGFG